LGDQDVIGDATAPNTKANPVAKAKFYLKVTDGNNCAGMDSVEVFVNSLPNATFVSDKISACTGDSAVLAPIAAGSDYKFKWINTQPYQVIGSGNTTKIVSSGTYRLVVSDGLTSCIDSSQNAFVFTNSPSNGAIFSSPSTCQNEAIVLIGNGSGDSLTYKWTTSGAGVLSNDTASTVSYQPSSSDPQVLNINLTVSNRCNTIGTSKSISLKPKPTISFTVPEMNFAGETVSFINTTDTISQKFSSFTWNFGDVNGINTFNTTRQFNEVNNYVATLIGTSVDNCKDTLSKVLQVLNGQVTFIPNAFSPNISQKAEENGVCKVYGRNISELDFNWQIFNRWGEVVYSTQLLKEASEIGWNGKFKNNGEDLPLGVYTYTINLKYLDGKKYEKTGTINIIR
jgi:hypothetical protein